MWTAQELCKNTYNLFTKQITCIGYIKQNEVKYGFYLGINLLNDEELAVQ